MAGIEAIFHSTLQKIEENIDLKESKDDGEDLKIKPLS